MRTRLPGSAEWRRVLFAMGAWLIAAAAVEAQRPLGGDLIFRNFFPPDLVLRHADEIGLTQDQRDALIAVMREARSAGEGNNRRVRDLSQTLAATIQEPAVNEQQMLKQLDELLQAEGAIKRNQLTMLARVKNQLSAEQQEKLRAFMHSAPGPEGAAGAPPGLGQHYENLSRHLSEMRPPAREGVGPEEKELRAAISDGLQQVRAGVDRWRIEQRDPAPIVEIMKSFAARMQSGDLKGARQQIDRAEATLNHPK